MTVRTQGRPRKTRSPHAPAWVLTGPTTMRRTECLDPHDRFDVLLADRQRLYDQLVAGHVSAVEYDEFMATIDTLMNGCLFRRKQVERAQRAARRSA